MNQTLKQLSAVILAAVVAGGVVYFVGERNLARLRIENANLRQQLAACAGTQAAQAATAESSAEREAQEREKTELLRLRGEVGVLRKQKGELEKLRQANVELTAALTKTGQPAGETPEPEADPERQRGIEFMNDARQLTLGLIMFAEDYKGTVVNSLNQSSNYWGSTSRLLTNGFELVQRWPLEHNADPSATILVRQKEAWLMKGSRVKVYGFADGHSELKREPAEGFEAWEQLHLAPPRPR